MQQLSVAAALLRLRRLAVVVVSVGCLCAFVTGASADTTVNLLGLQHFYKTVDFRLNDRMDAHVNVASGDLVVHANDMTIPGTGLNLVVARDWNSLSTSSRDLGEGWVLESGADVFLTVNGDSSVTFNGPSGYVVTFTVSGGSYVTPSGLDATLVKNGDGSFALTWHSSGEKYNFNSSGVLISDVDKNGNTISYGYSDGRLKSTTDTQGRTISVSDESPGRIKQVEDSTGRSNDHDYENGDLTEYTDLAGKSTQYGYDSNGLLTQITDPDGELTTFAYDGSRRVTSVTRADSPGPDATWTFTYNAGSTVVEDPDGNKTTYAYDSQGRVTSVTDALGNETATTYSPDSNVAQFTHAGGGISVNSYDAAGEKLMASQIPTGAQVQFSYGDSAHPFYPTGLVDPQGNSFNYAYDTNGNLCAKSEGSASLTCTNGAGQNPITFTHNPNGTVATATDARGATTSYSYDPKGNLTGITYPSPLGSVSLGYDALSRLTSFTDGKGQKTTFTYDALDRLTKIGYADGTSVAYQYDADGNVLTITDSSGITHFTYDPLNRVTQKQLVDGTSQTYTWDGVGNLLSYKDANGTVSYHYNQVNLVDKLTDPSGAVTTFGYDPDYNRTTTTYPNDVDLTATYDPSDRITAIKAANGSDTLTDYTYSYVKGGADTALRQQVGLPLAGDTESFTYDTADRLLGATVTGNASASVSYGYDGNGNRTSQTVNGTTTTYSYNAANELTAAGGTSYSYDADGNLTGSSDGLSLSYDAANQTVSITQPGGGSVAMSYTGAGQSERIKAGGDSFDNSLLGVSAWTEHSGSVNAFVRDPQGNLVADRTGGATYYYLFDGQGSVVGLTGASGSLTKGFTYGYDPYGDPATTPPSGYPDNPFTFTGNFNAYTDTTTGMYKVGDRYYQPTLGRWTQQDPLANPIDTHGWNPYFYAGDDPVNFVDPTGTVSILGVTSVATGGVGLGCTVAGLVSSGAGWVACAVGFGAVSLATGIGDLLGL